MKRLFTTLLIALFFTPFLTQVQAQQWAGSLGTGGSIYRSGNVGIGLASPGIAPLDVRGSNIYLAPAGSVGFSSKFIGLGESGGDCKAYGLRVQSNDRAFVNLHMEQAPFFIAGSDNRTPTMSWGAEDTRLVYDFICQCFIPKNRPRPFNFKYDDNGSGCGSLVASMYAPSETYQFRVYGDALANNWTPSDERYKSNIKTIKSADDILSQLRGVTYDMRKDEFPEMNFKEGRNYGFIAQELKEVMPEVVKADEKGFYAVQYTALVPVLVEGYKNQQETIENQGREITELRNELAEIKALLSGNSATKVGQSGSGASLNEARLFNNQPNPFSESTIIRYFLPENAENAFILISDLNGKVMQTLKLNQVGEAQVTLEAGSLSAGVYLYSLSVNGQKVATERMILSK